MTVSGAVGSNMLLLTMSIADRNSRFIRTARKNDSRSKSILLQNGVVRELMHGIMTIWNIDDGHENTFFQSENFIRVGISEDDTTGIPILHRMKWVNFNCDYPNAVIVPI